MPGLANASARGTSASPSPNELGPSPNERGRGPHDLVRGRHGRARERHGRRQGCRVAPPTRSSSHVSVPAGRGSAATSPVVPAPAKGTPSGAWSGTSSAHGTPVASILAGAPIAAAIREQVAADVAAFRRRHGYVPALAILVLGRDPSFAVYVRQIVRACAAVGLQGREVRVTGRLSPGAVRRALLELGADPQVAGVIVQHPLPRAVPLRTVLDSLPPAKDVDGVTPEHAGRLTLGLPAFAPATAQAAIEILEHAGIELEGRHAVVVGRSRVVGRPVAQLLLQRHCTVTICHSRTRDLADHTRRADVLVVAAGSPGLVTGSMIKPGATVIDVGTTVVDGRVVGDVDAASACEVAGALTPVPGGVGPVTNAVLLQHVIRAAQEQVRGSRPNRR